MLSENDNVIKCLVLRTSLVNKTDVERISPVMNDHPDILEWSVDLENWEKVLRVECTGLGIHEVQYLLKEAGFYSNEMKV